MRGKFHGRPAVRLLCVLALSGLLGEAGRAQGLNLQNFESDTPQSLSREIRTEAAGTVVKIHCQAGDKVSMGDVLAELDSDSQKFQMDLTKAQMEAEGGLTTALGQLQQREADHEQMSELFRKRQATKFQVDSAAGWVQWADGQVKSNQELLKVYAIQHAYWSEQYRKRFIVSPYDGVVVEAKLTLGAPVGVAALAYTIQNPEAVTFSVAVPAELAETLKVGDSLPVRTKGSNIAKNARLLEIVTDPSTNGAKRKLSLVVNDARTDAAGQLAAYQLFLKGRPAAPDNPAPDAEARAASPFATPAPAVAQRP